MRITRLSKIKKHRIFRDFTWPNDLPEFAQFNVIYGWNGSGKTALSVLFEHLQGKEAISESEVEFELDGGQKISGGDIRTANIPSVRVFNRNFIARTVQAIGDGDVAPIYVLGEKSVDLQQQAEKLKAKFAVAKENVTTTEKSEKAAESGLDNFYIGKARLIKETLMGSTQHANYNKGNFKQAITTLSDLSTPPVALSDTDKGQLRKQKELQAKDPISRVSISIPDIANLHSRTSKLLVKSVTSQVIEELVNIPTIGSWVQQGLSLHKNDYETNICRFCENELSLDRRKELEAHFNDALTSFQKEITQDIKDIEHQQSLMDVEFPDKARVYDHQANEAQNAINTAKDKLETVSNVLGSFKDALERKKESPFEEHQIEGAPVSNTLVNDLSEAIQVVNDIIDNHEQTTEDLADKIKDACQKLEQDYVLEALPQFKKLSGAAKQAKTDHTTAKEELGKLEEQIGEIEQKIVEHRRPAEELNAELRAYLGHDELKFEVKETGYELKRGGHTAKNLSDGERTAIAFLHFLKSLKDKDFNLRTGIVVIDDPVSSLDSNALFSAFGYMQERTKECLQLFILTHNFTFFRQIKNWFHHIKGQGKKDISKRPGRFYWLHITNFDDERTAFLARLDPLLEEFESEYHFLFKQVYDTANSTASGSDLTACYGMPNIARRLIETFLAYRFPDIKGNLREKFGPVKFDEAKKIRILRLLHTYSHSGGINEPENDPSVLGETKEVMLEILKLIEATASDHYKGMEKLMQRDRI